MDHAELKDNAPRVMYNPKNGQHEPSEALKTANGRVPPAHEGFAGLFFTSVTNGRGLPLELFLAVMRHVRIDSESDLVYASHVCPAWRSAILDCPDLWDELNHVEIGASREHVRLCTTASRAKGFLRELGLSIECDFFDDNPPAATLALRDAFREISQRDGARRLRTLKVDLSDLRGALGDPDVVLACVVQTVNFAELASVRLKTLKLVTDADRFPAGAPFFAALPDLEELLLVSRSHITGDGRLPDFFNQVGPASPTPTYGSMLTKLKLQGVSLPDSVLPHFPHLRHVKLDNVQCCNLFGLLSACSASLEQLWLFGVEADPANRYLPPAPDAAGQKDVPGTLELPALQELLLVGKQTPSFWIPPAPTTSHFIVATPTAKKIGLGWQHGFRYIDEDEEFVPAAENLKSESLATLFRKSPELTALNLEMCSIDSQTLSTALAFAPGSLTTLCIGGTAAARSDEVVDRLHVLLPSLEWLDVFDPEKGEDVPSLPALARLASRLRVKRSLSNWVGAFRLTIVTRNPDADGGDNETPAELRDRVRAILLTLSTAQVSHVPARLLVNLPPNAPTFEQIQQEILDLAEPPARTPILGADANGDGANPPKPPPPRPAGTQRVFEEACTLTQKWQRAREDELAVQYCQQAIGVELKWGVGCGDWNCDCRAAHPGYSEWHEER